MNTENFYSIDRLVEFGLGIGVAQQMVKSMNHALTSTHFSGTMNPMGTQRTTSATFVIIDEKQAGPFSEEELARLIVDGKVSKTTYVWRFGMPKWEMVESVAEVLRLVALFPPPFKPEK